MEVGKIHCKYYKVDPCSQQSLLVLASIVSHFCLLAQKFVNSFSVFKWCYDIARSCIGWKLGL